MSARFYKHDDIDAPVLSGLAASLIDIIKATLIGVAGVAYGSGANEKNAVGGWSVVEDDAINNVLVIRNSLAHGGTGCCVKITNDSNTCEIETGREWDANTSTLVDTTGSWQFTASDVSTSAPRKWAVVASERVFYVFIKPRESANAQTSITDSTVVGGGDYISFYPADATRYFALRHSTTQSLLSTITVGTSNISSNNAAILTGGRGNVFTPTPAKVFGTLLNANPSGSGTPNSEGNTLPATNPPDGRIFSSPAYIRVGNNNEISGIMPYMHIPINHLANNDPNTFIEIIPTETVGAGVHVARIRIRAAVNGNQFAAVLMEIE
jgi:hypothetical protein